MQIVRAQSAAEWAVARVLIEEYAATLDVDLAFQDFSREIEHLATEYGPPRGALLLAIDGDDAVGCVGLRPFDGATGEVKRLYVAPRARGLALGRRLAVAAVTTARELGYRRLVLDTLPTMDAAQSLYRAIGFTEIDAYRYNPVPGTVFMELHL